MRLRTPYKQAEVIETLKEEIDSEPSIAKTLLTLNANTYRGTSRVCGEVYADCFELRNRRDPYLSLRAYGRIEEKNDQTEISIRFEKPFFIDVFFRYKNDRRVILEFLEETTKALGIS